jgi:spore maturation protein CgeB
MRALVVAPGPHYSVADVYRGWAEGLAAMGVETRLFELDTLLQWYGSAHQHVDGEWVQPYDSDQATHLAAGHIRAECYAWWPDLVVIISGFFMYPMLVEMMRDRGHKVVLVATEEPYETTRTLEKARWGFDAVVLNDPVNLELYRSELDCPVLYGPHCYRPDLHCPGPASMLSDVAFVGTGYPSRQAFLQRVDWTGLNLALGGNWEHAPDELTRRLVHPVSECMDNADTVRLYRGATTAFNLYRIEDDGGLDSGADGWAIGPREVELAATGTWFARQSRPESDELFPMLPTFDSPEDLGEILRWAIAHPYERMLAAEQARAAVADRTFPKNAERLLQALDV